MMHSSPGLRIAGCVPAQNFIFACVAKIGAGATELTSRLDEETLEQVAKDGSMD
jgi:hypothetical protein